MEVALLVDCCSKATQAAKTAEATAARGLLQPLSAATRSAAAAGVAPTTSRPCGGSRTQTLPMFLRILLQTSWAPTNLSQGSAHTCTSLLHGMRGGEKGQEAQAEPREGPPRTAAGACPPSRPPSPAVRSPPCASAHGGRERAGVSHALPQVWGAAVLHANDCTHFPLCH